MAIQRIIDEECIPPRGPGGRRVALGIALQPTHRPAPQPIAALTPR